MILEVGKIYIESVINTFVPPNPLALKGATVMIVVAADKTTLANPRAFGHIRFHVDNLIAGSQDKYLKVNLGVPEGEELTL